MVWWLWASQMHPFLTGAADSQESVKPIDSATAEMSKHGLQASCVWSPVDGFCQFSDNWHMVTGQLPGDCMQEHWQESWHPSMVEMFDQSVADMFSAAPEDRTDSMVIEGDVMHGEGRWRTLQLAMIASGIGTQQKLTLLVSDVSEQREMEQEVRRAQHHSKALEHCRGSFLANMSHELRTPLNAILGFAQMLEQKQVSDEQSAKDYLKNIRISGEDLLHKISDLIELANIDSGKAELAEQPMNVSEAIAAVIEMQSHRAFEKGVTLHQDTNCPHLVIRADRARLLHCLGHQLNEAIAQSPENSFVTIGYHADAKKGVRLSVHDHGAGISQRRLQNIRNSLHRSESYYQTDIEDITIGLAVCKEIMELHGGKLTVDSRIGRGTITTLHFPAERIVSMSAKVKRKKKQFG